MIFSAINKVAGRETRELEYLHWWTFLAAYNEIGDCLYAQGVSIRKKLKQGKKLDKSDQAFYRANRELIDMRGRATSAEEDMFDEWTRG